MDLTPALRQRLGRIRLVAPTALAAGGVGDRRSAQRGEGIEFEQHRPYEVGDDARRVDPHLFARFGTAFVREYNVSQQLTVTILLDASRSMGTGSPRKLDVARTVATGIALTALAGSDAVQTAVWSGDRLAWRPRASGLPRLDDLERAWRALRPTGTSDLAAAVRRIRNDLPRRGMTVLISDLWSDEAQSAIDLLSGAQQALLVVQLLDRDEVEPEPRGGDVRRFVDVETGEEVDVALGDDQLARYATLLATWTDALRQRAFAAGGTFVRVTTDQSAEDVFLRTLPAAGVLR